MKSLLMLLFVLSLYSCDVPRETTKEEEYKDSILVVTDAVKDSSSSHIPSDIDTANLK
jgi:hypothetical protein